MNTRLALAVLLFVALAAIANYRKSDDSKPANAPAQTQQTAAVPVAEAP